MSITLHCEKCGKPDNDVFMAIDGSGLWCGDCMKTPARTWETDRAWFHGGIPGLKPGDLILPPDVTGASGTMQDQDHGVVWVTTSLYQARTYAKDLDPGDLYQVRPDGLDTDCQNPHPETVLAGLRPEWRGAYLQQFGPSGPLMCKTATVLQVVEQGLRAPAVRVSVNGGPERRLVITRAAISPHWHPAPGPVQRED